MGATQDCSCYTLPLASIVIHTSTMHTWWSYDSLSPYKASFGTVTAKCVWWLACGAPVATIHTIHVQSIVWPQEPGRRLLTLNM